MLKFQHHRVPNSMVWAEAVMNVLDVEVGDVETILVPEEERKEKD